MGSSLMSAPSLFGLTGLAGVLSDEALRATLLLVVVFGVVGLLRQSSAAARHLAWTVGLVSVLALPLLGVSIPWRLEVLPVIATQPASAPMAGGDAMATRVGPMSDLADAPAPAVVPDQSHRRAHGAPVSPGGRPSVKAPDSVLSPSAITPGVTPAKLDILDVLLGVWAAVAALLALRLLGGVVTVWFLARRSQPLTGRWSESLCGAMRRLGVTRPVTLLMSDRVAVPITAGLRRPVIVLPRAATDWTDDRRSAVLLHELAHIKRGDWATHLIARGLSAVHWFNPLFWLAAKRVRAESERACDDLVLEAGTQPSCYADHLLQIVKTAGRTHAPAGALPLAQRSEFEGRLLAILEAGLPRHRLKPARALLLASVLAAFSIPLAAMAPIALEPTVGPDSVEPVAAVEESTDDEAVGTSLHAMQLNRGESEAESVEPSFDEPLGDTATSLSVEIAAPVVKAQGQSLAKRTALVSALGDSDAKVRAHAAQSLGEVIDANADTLEIAALSRTLRTDPEPQVRRMAAWALGEIEDSRGVPALIDALQSDQDAGVRKMAAWALGEIEDAQAVPALGAALQDEDPEVRRAAIHAMGEIESPAAVEYLIPALSSNDPMIKKHAAWALGEIEDPRAIEALGRAVRDPVVEVRRAAIHALGELDSPQALDILMTALQDEDAQIRKQAAWALGEIDDARAVDPLSAALKDPNAEVRRAAAHGLGEIESPRAVDALVAALKDADAQVRKHAAWALGEIEDARAVAPLGAALKDSDVEVRRAAIYALGEIESPAAVDMLIPALKDADQKVRRYAAWALGEVEDPRAKDPLIAAVADQDAEVRRAAINALSELELRPAPPAVVKALTDSDPQVRRAAAHALGHWEDPGTIPALKAAMKDADPKVRREALTALAEMPGQDAIDALVEALKDDDPATRRAAAQALGKND